MRAAFVSVVTLGVLTLAGCGVDGAPKAPAQTTQTGVKVSGEAEMGVAFKP
jgi:hypothetical protein